MVMTRLETTLTCLRTSHSRNRYPLYLDAQERYLIAGERPHVGRCPGRTGGDKVCCCARGEALRFELTLMRVAYGRWRGCNPASS